VANNGRIVGLDIGSTKVCCVIATPSESGEGDLVISGVGEAPSEGLRKGRHRQPR